MKINLHKMKRQVIGWHGESIQTQVQKKKIKAEMNDFLMGQNSCGIVDYNTYSKLYDFTMKLLDKMYLQGLHDSTIISKELKEYRNLEKQGLLLKPKIPLNSFVYIKSEFWGIIPYVVRDIYWGTYGFRYKVYAFKGDDLLDDQEIVDDDLGKFAFLTEEEATLNS